MSVGLLVGGRYELRATLGRGGFGTVWRAHDRTLGREVAVKIIAFDELTADRDDIRRRFSREAQAVAALNHPNVVTAHDFGVEGNTAYLVMELINGGSLEDELVDRRKHSRPPFDIGTVTTIGAQVCAGLGAAHAAGLVHRDLKPANVMRAAGGIVKIVDFGIARDNDRSRMTQSGVYLGTLRYTAPEQMSGEMVVDGRADLYSLGCVMFELLTGRSPYEAYSPIQWVAAHQLGQPKSLAELRPDAPADLVALLRDLLAKSPDQRPATAEAVRTRLVAIHAATSAAGVARVVPANQTPPAATAADQIRTPPPTKPHPPAPTGPPPYQMPYPPRYQPAPAPVGYGAGNPYGGWPPYGIGPGPPPARPVTVTIAVTLLVISAALSASILVGLIVAYGAIEAAWHASFDAIIKPGDTSDIGQGFGIIAIATCTQLGAALALAYPVYRGGRVARQLTWIFVAATSLCCAGTLAVPSWFTPVSDDIASGKSGQLNAASAQFRAAFPGWLDIWAVTVGIVGALVLITAAVLLAVPPSNRFFQGMRRFRPVRLPVLR